MVLLADFSAGKSDELPRKPLGQELLSPVQPSGGRPSSAGTFPRADLSLHIISQQPESISPDQSPSKDPSDLEAPLPSPDPVIIHCQVPLTPDSSPLMGPPPYRPPGSPGCHPSLLPNQDRDEAQPDIDDDLSAPTSQGASSTLSTAQPESLLAAEETDVPARLLDPALAPSCSVNLNQGWSAESEDGPEGSEAELHQLIK